MLLDIIIPQYKEDENKIKILLDSIKNQKHIDFNDINITIVNDASDVLLSNEFINNYDLNIKYIKNKINGGPGVTRQVGIDNTNGKFIMFIDADDHLINDENIFYILFSCINDMNPDLIVTNIVSEKYIDGNIKYFIKTDNDTFPWLHGKIYKRETLNKYNIRFHDKLRCQEDQYFTTCLLGHINLDEIIHLNLNTYMWCNNENSITRRNRKYEFLIDIFDDFYNCVIYTYEYLNKSNSIIKNNYVIKGIFGIYTLLNCDSFDYEELKNKKLKYLNELKEFIFNNKDIFSNYKFNDLNILYKEELEKLIQRCNYKKIYKDLYDFCKDYNIGK